MVALTYNFILVPVPVLCISHIRAAHQMTELPEWLANSLNDLPLFSPNRVNQVITTAYGSVQQQMAHPPDTASSWSTIFENKDWLNPKAQFDESRFKTQSQILIRDVATDFGFDPPTNRTPTRTPMTPTRRSPLRDSLRGCTPMGDFTRGNSSVGGSIAGSMESRETGLFGAL